MDPFVLVPNHGRWLINEIINYPSAYLVFSINKVFLGIETFYVVVKMSGQSLQTGEDLIKSGITQEERKCRIPTAGRTRPSELWLSLC